MKKHKEVNVKEASINITSPSLSNISNQDIPSHR
jgi:hypothetical protein